jgi:hypothetical protein
MSTYINITTKQYPLHQGDIRLEVDGIGEEFVCPEGYAEVQPSLIPVMTDTQNCVEEAPILLQDGTWIKQFRVFDMTAEEIAARDRWMAEEAPPDYLAPLDNDQPGSAPNVVG